MQGALVVGADPSVRELFSRGLHCRLRHPEDEATARHAVIAAVSAHRSGVRIRLQDLHTREGAEALVGTLIELPRDQMPVPAENEYYDYDIIGLTAVDLDERVLGTVVEIIPTGACDVYVIAGEEGELLVPATSHAVLAIELEHHRIVVDPETGVRST